MENDDEAKKEALASTTGTKIIDTRQIEGAKRYTIGKKQLPSYESPEDTHLIFEIQNSRFNI